MIARWLSLLAAQLIFKAALRGLLLGLLIAAVVAALPISLVGAGAFAAAWYRGWQPRRLLTAAAWCLPMVVVWLAVSASTAPVPWLGLAAAPYHAWLAFWQLARSGAIPRAAATIAPEAIPLGLIAGSLAWAYRTASLRAGAGGTSPAATAAFDQRQWRHETRAALARISTPGSVPLTTRRDRLPVGAVIRTVGHRAGTVATIGYQRIRSHQVVVGTTGTGKPIYEL